MKIVNMKSIWYGPDNAYVDGEHISFTRLYGETENGSIVKFSSSIDNLRIYYDNRIEFLHENTMYYVIGNEKNNKWLGEFRKNGYLPILNTRLY